MKRISALLCAGLLTAMSGCGALNSGSGSDGDSDSDSGSSPLAEWLGYSGDPVAQREQDLKIEEAIAKCMREEGFEYQPVDYGSQPGGGADQFSDDFGKEHGYGIMYNYETYEGAEDDGASFVDPNEDYVGSLSGEEQNAYYAALYGDFAIEEPSDVEEDEVVSAPTLEEQGCSGKGRKEVVGDDPISDPAINDLLENTYTEFTNSPEFIAATNDFLDCIQPKLDELNLPIEPKSSDDMYGVAEAMIGTGRGLTLEQRTADEAEEMMDESFDESGEGTTVSPIYLSSEMEDTTNGGSSWVLVGKSTTLTADQIDDLTKQEVDLWNADQKCQDESGMSDLYDNAEQKLVDQLEAEYPEYGKS